MKILVAPDSFKGSISAYDACLAIKKGIVRCIPEADVVLTPIADGGEGTLDAMVPPERRIRVSVLNPEFERIEAEYGYTEDTAVVEMARAAGLTLLPEEKRNAGATTTFGVGELILHALKSGFRRIMLTVGGSATNDGGCGMLAALGAKFTRRDGTEFVPTGDTLCEIESINVSEVAKELFESEILIATDVKNPLLGEDGATFVYARQKGLVEGQKERLEKGMTNLASVLKKESGKDVALIEGCGAGGGISAVLLAFANAKIKSGIETVLEVAGFLEAVDGCAAVITGEGKIDSQSLFGKAISGVAKVGIEKSVPVYCFVGCVGDDLDKLLKMGLSGIYDVASLAESTEDSIKNADKYLTELAEKFSAEILSKKTEELY